MNKEQDQNLKTTEKLFLKAYDSYGASILRHSAFRVSDRNAAEDITSETFLKAWNHIKKNGEVKNFKAFLYRIADNLIIDHYRAKKYQPVGIDTIDEDALRDETDLPREFERSMSFAMLQRNLDSMPEEHRAMLTYRYIDELDILTIKKLTGKSLTNIYVTIHRALKNLKKKIIETDEK